MRFSNGAEFRYFTSKYALAWRRLTGVGGGFFILSWFIGEPAKAWVEGIGLLAVIAALAVLLAGMIAARKDWEAADKTDTK
jgi:hypothetical protein